MKETNMDIGMKAKSALDAGLKVILCVGETTIEYEQGKTDEVNAMMLSSVAAEISPEQWKNVVIAYEPCWAIGTGKTPKPEEISASHSMIRAWLSNNINKAVAQQTRIIYGGSVNEKNCEEFIQQRNVDGFLVGGASLKPEFKTICDTVN